MSRRWAGWIGDALEPSDDEVARLRGGVPAELVERIVTATEPTEQEILAVRQRLREPAPRPIAPWAVGVGLTLVATAAVALVVASVDVSEPAAVPSYGPVSVAVGTPLVGTGASVVELGPSIDLVAEGTYIVEAAGEAGTEIRLLDGRVHLDVVPDGAFRALTVRADDVAVSVVGTVFDVTYDGKDVAVSVARGRVAVRWEDGEVFVSGGSSWKRPPAGAVAAVEGTADPDPAARTSAPARHPAAPDRAPVESADDPAVDVPMVAADPDVVSAGRDEAGAAEIGPRIRMGPADAEFAQLIGLTGRAAAGLVPPDVAIEELDAFLRRHPNSAEAVEAEVARLTLLPAVDASRAAEEMRSWLDDNPNHSRAPMIRYELARVTHERLDRCSTAIRLYREIADDDGDVYRGRAAAGAGLCAVELGSARLARKYLRQALDSGIEGPLRVEVERALVGVGGTDP